MNLRVATLNIGEDLTNPFHKTNICTYEYILSLINKYEIDIFCFQEAITCSKSIIPISRFLYDNSQLKYSAFYEYDKSHINTDSMMGVVICSKVPILNIKILKFDNPRISYQVDEKTTYVMHDKGFIVVQFSNTFLIANGHGFPFYSFKQNPLDYKYTYENMESLLLGTINNINDFVILGDFNHTSIKDVYPRICAITNNNINEVTQTVNNTGYQVDYILTSKNINVKSSNVIKTNFDHKLCMVNIDCNII